MFKYYIILLFFKDDYKGKFWKKQNTYVDFKSQLQSNIIKIFEKNIISNNNNKNKNKNDKKSGSYKNSDDSNNIIYNKEKKDGEPMNGERKKQINLNSIKIIESKIIIKYV